MKNQVNETQLLSQVGGLQSIMIRLKSSLIFDNTFHASHKKKGEDGLTPQGEYALHERQI